MSDLIERQAVINSLHHRFMDGFVEDRFWNSTHVLMALRETPSAEPEIIRCKDCLIHGVCRFEQGLGLDGYCSKAERRTDG